MGVAVVSSAFAWASVALASASSGVHNFVAWILPSVVVSIEMQGYVVVFVPFHI